MSSVPSRHWSEAMSEHEPELFFDIVHSIGHGGQADVYLVRLRKTGGVYAGKFLREARDPLAREAVRRGAMRQDPIGRGHVGPIIAWKPDAGQPVPRLRDMPRTPLSA